VDCGIIFSSDAGGTNFDFSGLRADRREQREWGCQLPREVMNPKVGSVHAQTLGLSCEVNRLEECVSRRLRL